jgi:hypothetical protein
MQKGSRNVGSVRMFTVWLINYVIVDVILVEKSFLMYGCANLESVELKTSFGLMSWVRIGGAGDDGCRSIARCS